MLKSGKIIVDMYFDNIENSGHSLFFLFFFFGKPRTLHAAQLVSRSETVPNFPCLQQLEINTWTKNE